MTTSIDCLCQFLDDIQKKLEGSELKPEHRQVWEAEYLTLLNDHYLDLPPTYAGWMHDYREKKEARP